MENKNRIIGIDIKSGLGILAMQKLELDPLSNAIKVKAGNGEGKSTMSYIYASGIAGAKYLPKRFRGEGFEITYTHQLSENIVYETVKDRATGLESKLIMLDSNGKKMPAIIDGERITPAMFHSLISTELSYGAENLTDPKLRKSFLFGDLKSTDKGVYSEKLEAVGIYFDKTHPNFNNSIIHQIQQGIIERDQKRIVLDTNNAHATTLQAEGIFDEQNKWIDSVEYVDIKDLETKKESLNREIAEINTNIKIDRVKASSLHDKEQNEILQGLKDSLRDQDSILEAAKGGLTTYNNNIDADFEKIKLLLKIEIDAQNERIQLEEDARAEILNNQKKLQECVRFFSANKLGDVIIYQVNEAIKQLPPVEPKKDFEVEKAKLIKPAKISASILADENLCELVDVRNLVREYKQALADKELAEKAVREFKPKEFIYKINPEFNILIESKQNEIKGFDNLIESALISNAQYNRVFAFENWIATDRKVRSLYKKRDALLAAIDTGVNGLSFKYDEESKSIDLFFNPLKSDSKKHFSDLGKEQELIFDSFSQAEQSLITIMMQNYLLSSKRFGSRGIWTEANITHSTFKEVERLANLYDIQVFCSFSGDYKSENLGDNEILIENGELLFKN